MNSREYSDQHLLNAIGYHERKLEELRDELESRGIAGTTVLRRPGGGSDDTSMLDHRVRTLEGRIASLERKIVAQNVMKILAKPKRVVHKKAKVKR